jgi:hypothetical protein
MRISSLCCLLVVAHTLVWAAWADSTIISMHRNEGYYGATKAENSEACLRTAISKMSSEMRKDQELIYNVIAQCNQCSTCENGTVICSPTVLKISSNGTLLSQKEMLKSGLCGRRLILTNSSLNGTLMCGASGESCTASISSSKNGLAKFVKKVLIKEVIGLLFDLFTNAATTGISGANRFGQLIISGVIMFTTYRNMCKFLSASFRTKVLFLTFHPTQIDFLWCHDACGGGGAGIGHPWCQVRRKVCAAEAGCCDSLASLAVDPSQPSPRSLAMLSLSRLDATPSLTLHLPPPTLLSPASFPSPTHPLPPIRQPGIACCTMRHMDSDTACGVWRPAEAQRAE